jgi:hypothetical protein
MTRQPFHLLTAAVAGTYLDVVGNSGRKRALLYSYWLKLQGAERYAGVAPRWTDGANFYPDEIPIDEGDRIEAAEVGADGVLRVSWRDGTAVQLSAEQVRRAVDNADAADVQPILWNAETVIPRFEYEVVIESGKDKQLFGFLRAFLQHGLVFLNNVPRRPDQVAIAAARLSTIQASHLGQTFSIMAASEPHHIAETCDGIPQHIDMVYKQAPPDAFAACITTTTRWYSRLQHQTNRTSRSGACSKSHAVLKTRRSSWCPATASCCFTAAGRSMEGVALAARGMSPAAISRRTT